MQFPEVYENMFRAAIVRDDVGSALRTPVVNCDPVVRGHPDDMSSSSLTSHALCDILKQNADMQQQLQTALFENMKGLTKSAMRPVGVPPQLAGGAKPTVTQFIEFVEGVSQKYSAQNCKTSRALELWLKDLQMSDQERESSLGPEENLRLWEVIHACIDKAVTDSLSADVQSSKDGLKLLNAVFLKVIRPEFRVYTDRCYKFFNATVAVPAANIANLQSEFVNWLKAMTEVRYLDKVTAQELWTSMYQFFAYYKMLQDHLRDHWTPNGTSHQFDKLIASIPDAIMMTQKALGVTPVDEGFQVQQGRNRKKTPSGGPSANGLDRRNSAPDILQPNHGRQPLSQAERIKNGVCPNYPRNCRFGDVCKFQHVEPKGKTENLGKPEKQNVRSVGVVKDSQQNSDIEQKLVSLLRLSRLWPRS